MIGLSQYGPMSNPIIPLYRLGFPNNLLVKVIFHRQRYRKRVITFFLPKPIFWSAKNMVWLIGWKILGIRDLQTCSTSQRIDLRTFRSTYEHFFSLNLYSNIVFYQCFQNPTSHWTEKVTGSRFTGRIDGWTGDVINIYLIYC